LRVCQGKTVTGQPCKKHVTPPARYCHIHSSKTLNLLRKLGPFTPVKALIWILGAIVAAVVSIGVDAEVKSLESHFLDVPTPPHNVLRKLIPRPPAIAYVKSIKLPEIEVAPYPRPAIEYSSTVPGATPIYRVRMGDNKLRAQIKLTNIGKGRLTGNPKVQVVLLAGVNLKCLNRSYNPIPSRPEDGTWSSAIEVPLDDIPPRKSVVLDLSVEYASGGAQDWEVKCTIFGKNLPDEGVVLPQKLCIQRM
jgi:hypothetical protein